MTAAHNRRYMNAAFFVLCCIILFIITGCCSARRVDKSILEYQRQIAILEARVHSYENTIGNTIKELESLRDRAQSFNGTVDEVIELFDAYQRAVEQLLQQNGEGQSSN